LIGGLPIVEITIIDDAIQIEVGGDWFDREHDLIREVLK
jgi:hypothetical protein